MSVLVSLVTLLSSGQVFFLFSGCFCQGLWFVRNSSKLTADSTGASVIRIVELFAINKHLDSF